MPIDVYETSTIEGEAILDVGFQGGAVVFTFLQDDVPIAQASKTIQATAEQAGQGVKQPCVAPLVPDAKESYLLKVQIDAAGTRVVNEEYRVWPLRATVKASDDSGPVKGFRFWRKQGGARSDTWFETPSGGTSAPFDLAKQPFSVEPAPPWEITRVVVGKGRKRELEVRKVPYTIEIAAPTAANHTCANLTSNDPTEGLRQYTNLTTAASGQDGLGHTVKVDVQVKEVDQRGVGQQKAYLRVQHTKAASVPGKVRRTAPEPKLDPAGLDNHVDQGKDGDGLGTYTAELALVNGLGSFTVEVGQTGGDRCEIKVGSTAECGDGKLVLENWRQIDYELRTSKEMLSFLEAPAPDGKAYDLPSATRSKLTEIGKSIFVEFLLAGASLAAPPNAPSLGQDRRDGFLLPKSFMDPTDTSGAKLLCLVRTMNGGIRTKWDAFQRTRKPITLCVWFCHVLYSAGSTATTVERSVTTARASIPIAPSSWVPVKFAVTGLSWEAEPRPQDLQLKKAVITVNTHTTVAVDKAKTRTLKIAGTAGDDDLVFVKPGALSHVSTAVTDPMRQQIRDLLAGVTDERSLRDNGDHVVIDVTGEGGNDRRRDRLAHVKQAIEDEFATLSPSRYAHPAVTSAGVARSGNLNINDINVGASSAGSITIDLPDDFPSDPGSWVGPADDTHSPVKVTLKVADGGLVGPSAYTGQPYVWMVPFHPYTFQMISADYLTMLLVHEFGHKMKMSMHGRKGTDLGAGLLDGATIADDEARYPKGGKLGHLYDGKAHSGPHCAYGLTDAEKGATDYTAINPDPAPACVMFGGQIGALVIHTLCPQCQDYLCAHPLESVEAT